MLVTDALGRLYDRLLDRYSADDGDDCGCDGIEVVQSDPSASEK
ncbi:MAG: hypothetical protein ABEJ88_02610 [Halobacterium sp.]